MSKSITTDSSSNTNTNTTLVGVAAVSAAVGVTVGYMFGSKNQNTSNNNNNNLNSQSTIVQGLSYQQPTENNMPYSSGSRTVFLHDQTRSFDPVGLGIRETADPLTTGILKTIDSRGTRTFPAEIWYPIRHNSVDESTRAHYYDFYLASGPNDTDAFNTFLKAYQVDGCNPSSINHTPGNFAYGRTYQVDVLNDNDTRYQEAMSRAFKAPRDSYKNAPIANGRFPVVFLYHGYSDCRLAFWKIAEFLSRQGYIVVAPDLTTISNISLVGKDPELATFNPFLTDSTQAGYPFLDSYGAYQQKAPFPSTNTSTGAGLYIVQAIESCRLDTLSVIKACVAMNNDSQSFLYNRLNLSNGVAVGGHSFGVRAALMNTSVAVQLPSGVPSISACLCYNKAQGMESEFLRTVPITINLSLFPFLQSGTIDFIRNPVLEVPTFLWTGGEDNTIVNSEFGFFNTGRQTGQPNATNPQPSNQNLFTTAKSHCYYSTYKNSLHNTINSFYPYQLLEFDPTLVPSEAISIYNSSGTLTFPFDATNPKWQMVPMDQFRKVMNSVTLAFFDAYLCLNKKAAEIMLEVGTTDYRYTVKYNGGGQ